MKNWSNLMKQARNQGMTTQEVKEYINMKRGEKMKITEIYGENGKVERVEIELNSIRELNIITDSVLKVKQDFERYGLDQIKPDDYRILQDFRNAHVTRDYTFTPQYSSKGGE